MYKINIVCVGNLKDKFYNDAKDEYIKMLKKFAEVKIIEVKEKNELNSINSIKEQEGKEIKNHLCGHICLLDVKGDLKSSEEFSSFIEKSFLTDSVITFIIGGSYGVSEEIKNLTNSKISFGKLTFPHRLFRIMLLEQVYRSFTISNKINYHK